MSNGNGVNGNGVATLLALVAFAVHVFTAAPGPYLLDSAELAAASFGLGIAHPPGEPLAVLWGKLWTLLPLGSVAFRVSLSQAAAGALAVALVHRTAQVLIDTLDPEDALAARTRAVLSALAAVGFALAPGAIFSANRPEVYALGTALALGAVLAALHATRDDPRPALLGALLVGLGLTNHPLLTGAAGLGAVAATLPLLMTALEGARTSGPRASPALRLLALSVLSVLAGLLVLAHLPARAAALHAPAAAGAIDTLAWGDGRTPSGLWWLLSARTFVGKNTIVQGNADPASLPFVLMEELGPLAVLALVGAWLSLRLSGSRRVAAAVAIAALGSMLAAAVAGLDPTNPDIRGYLGVALAALAVLGAAALAPLLAALHRPTLALAISAAALVATAAFGLSRAPSASLATRDAAEAAVAELLTEAPGRAVIATSHFETAFLVGYLRLVDGRRPDADWVHLGFVRGPGYAERLAAARPRLRPLLQAHATGQLDVGTVRAVGAPVLFEPDDHLPGPLREHLQPALHLWQLPDPQAASRETHLEPLKEAAFSEAEHDRQVRGFFAWRAYQDTLLACPAHPAVAGLRLQELQRLVPHDRRARSLADSCSPTRPRE